MINYKAEYVKKLILLSFLLGLSACRTINQESQCDPEKNYIISNTQAIEEYKKLEEKHQVRSIYYEDKLTENCNSDICLQFDNKKFDFIEKYFNDENKKGVYSVYQSNDLSRIDCVKHDTVAYGLAKKCFYTIKNENNIIKSTYAKKQNSFGDYSIVEFYNLQTKEILIKSSYQAYSTGAIGAIGAGFCHIYYNNNPQYNLNIFGLGE